MCAVHAQSQGEVVRLNRNGGRLSYPLPPTPATVSIFVLSAPLPLTLRLVSQRLFVYLCVFLCLDVFVPEAKEAEGSEVMPTLGVCVCVCVCPHCAKWKQRENRGTHLYNGVRTQPASGSLHLSITAPGCTHAHALWHTHTHSHYFSWFTPPPP